MVDCAPRGLGSGHAPDGLVGPEQHRGASFNKVLLRAHSFSAPVSAIDQLPTEVANAFNMIDAPDLNVLLSAFNTAC